MNKKIVYIDMDGVIVDFESGIEKLKKEDLILYKENYSKAPYIFSKMLPIPGAIDAVKKLSEKFDVYILSSPGWGNASAWSDKYEWINKYLPEMRKRLILSSQKHLNCGDYLIDDRLANGSEKFTGELIHFGNGKFKDWSFVLSYLMYEK
jgi:5'(3')-deoxyribonucleotidase